jgi:NAD(P)-dependent dehydrogenase (short-subunit alcohol dehydrogenase family)
MRLRAKSALVTGSARGIGAGFARPEDLVGAADSLPSDEADSVIAETLNVDGGQWMS